MWVWSPVQVKYQIFDGYEITDSNLGSSRHIFFHPRKRLLLFTLISVCAFGSYQDTISSLSKNLSIDSTTASHTLS